MDVAAALDLKERLQSELNAIMNHELILFHSEYLLAKEISRLNRSIPNEYNQSVADTVNIKIPVGNRYLMYQLALSCQLNGLSFLVDFRSELIGDLRTIANFRQFPLPLTYQFIIRVIKIFEDAIILEQNTQRSSSWKPPERGQVRIPLPDGRYGYGIYVNYCIDQAIDFEIYEPNGLDMNNVLLHLEENPSIVVDHTLRRIVQRRCVEATIPLHSNLAPAELTRRRSKL